MRLERGPRPPGMWGRILSWPLAWPGLCSERELADAEDGVGRGWRLGDLLQLFNFVTSSNSYFLWSTCNLSGRAFTQLSCFIPDTLLCVIDTFIPNYNWESWDAKRLRNMPGHMMSNFWSWNSTSGVCPTPRPVPSCCTWSMNRRRRESYSWDPGQWWGLCCLLRALMTRAFLPDPQPHSWLQGPAHLGWPCHLTLYPFHKHTHTQSQYFDLRYCFCLNYVLIWPHFLDAMLCLNLPSVSDVWTVPSLPAPA